MDRGGIIHDPHFQALEAFRKLTDAVTTSPPSWACRLGSRTVVVVSASSGQAQRSGTASPIEGDALSRSSSPAGRTLSVPLRPAAFRCPVASRYPS
jgi:hypothetical protein